jgi:hypothetical protein
MRKIVSLFDKLMKHSSEIHNLLGEILTLILIFCCKGCEAKASRAYSE